MSFTEVKEEQTMFSFSLVEFEMTEMSVEMLVESRIYKSDAQKEV